MRLAWQRHKLSNYIDIQNCHSMLKKILMEKEVFTQLALVNKTAVNKLEEFESLISQRPELLQKCMQLREYIPSDCAQLAELFYQTVHNVNAKDYT